MKKNDYLYTCSCGKNSAGSASIDKAPVSVRPVGLEMKLNKIMKL